MYGALDSCKKFDTNDNKLKEVATMNSARSNAACAVFVGKVVASGGYNGEEYTNTVEAYDYVADMWSYMPNMIERRWNHSSVAIKNKLFVITSNYGDEYKTYEVFDSTFKRFVLFKPKLNSLKFRLYNIFQSVIIGNKIIMFGHRSSTALCYDVNKNEWTEKPFKATKYSSFSSCVLVPKIDI